MTQPVCPHSLHPALLARRLAPAFIGAILLAAALVSLLVPPPAAAGIAIDTPAAPARLTRPAVATDTVEPPVFGGNPLQSPANAATLLVTRPAFGWLPATGEVLSYTLRLTGSGGVTDVVTLNPAYIPTVGLPGGDYAWSVQAHGPGGESGFVPPYTFTIDAAPVWGGNPLLSPADGAALTAPSYRFTWAGAAAGEVVRYTLRLTTPTRVIDYSTTASPLPVNLWENGAYSWSLRAENAAGESSGFAPPYRFSLSTTWQIYLPFTIRTPEPECPVYSGNSYDIIPIEDITTDRPGPLHADLNLSLRGWVETNQPKGLIQYNGKTDDNAPQLDGLFSPRRFNGISSVYKVYHWDWGKNSRDGLIIDDWPVFMMGLPTTPKENIYPPGRSPQIYGGGYKVMVLYAEERRITLAFTRRDTVAVGYAVHLENLCVDPNLLALYRTRINDDGWHLPGRQMYGGYLPALRSDQPVGVALDQEILVVIRDTGRFMDPRSRKDWWKDYPATLISVQKHDTLLSK
jgi:hypothetical protein